MGKLSSDFSGCSTRSTSSIMQTPCFNWTNILPISTHSRRICGVFFFARRSLAMPSCSKKRSCKDLTSAGVLSIMSPWLHTRAMRADRFTSRSRERSHLNVETLFCTTVENAFCITDRESMIKAWGTTKQTNRDPSASIKANKGDTTEVLPAPMIICFTTDFPVRNVSKNSETISTCLGRSKKPVTNSKIKKRGSKVASKPLPLETSETVVKNVLLELREPQSTLAFSEMPASRATAEPRASGLSKISIRLKQLSRQRQIAMTRLATSIICDTEPRMFCALSVDKKGFSNWKSVSHLGLRRPQQRCSNQISVSMPAYRNNQNLSFAILSLWPASVVSKPTSFAAPSMLRMELAMNLVSAAFMSINLWHNALTCVRAASSTPVSPLTIAAICSSPNDVSMGRRLALRFRAHRATSRSKRENRLTATLCFAMGWFFKSKGMASSCMSEGATSVMNSLNSVSSGCDARAAASAAVSAAVALCPPCRVRLLHVTELKIGEPKTAAPICGNSGQKSHLGHRPAEASGITKRSLATAERTGSARDMKSSSKGGQSSAMLFAEVTTTW
mmetsp:Transcript_95654/g.309870  ORF Transcript_95654/g.309870 Transcript_95654/m.309870 type:complete len:561 (+) Transcript_95654:2543-4225(+)